MICVETQAVEASEMLEIAPSEADPVAIIAAAQLKLRRWRRMSLAADGESVALQSREAWQRIRDIIEARDAMLRRRRIPPAQG